MTIKANVTGTGNSAASANAIVGGVITTIASAGSNAATATLLPRATNIFITTGTGGVIIPPGTGTTQGLAAGDTIRVINQSGANCIVYPPTGGTINAASSLTVANNQTAQFTCLDGLKFGSILTA